MPWPKLKITSTIRDYTEPGTPGKDIVVFFLNFVSLNYYFEGTNRYLTVPYVASDFARRSFCFVSPTVGNSLPSDVQSSPSQTTFKSRLKTHLYNIAFNDQPELWRCVTWSAPQDHLNWHLARYKLVLLLFIIIISFPRYLEMDYCDNGRRLLTQSCGPLVSFKRSTS